MSRHTTWRVGGPADLFLVVSTLNDLIQALRFVENRRLPVFVLGNGSNLLVSDRGVKGAVIKLGKGFQRIKWEKDKIHSGCGVMLSTLVKGAALRGLGGLSFLAGIPGTLGGALMMNAGAYGGEIVQLLNRVKLALAGGKVQELKKEDLQYAYRQSFFPPGAVVWRAELAVSPQNPEKLMKEREAILLKRRNSHPEGPSAGSTFKNPPGFKAWELIDRAGLRGLTRGGLEVSAQHPNFILNHGGAKAGDLWDLICFIQKEVQAKTGLELEPEIKKIGRW